MIRYKRHDEPDTKVQKTPSKPNADRATAAVAGQAVEDVEAAPLNLDPAPAGEPLTLSLTEEVPRKTRKPVKRKVKNADANEPAATLPLLTSLDG
ncbi:hypothetical protein [Pararhizobium qamdonense]|uniref:hypothetical protein n=1 Tax=Pararhizobium qamdonense TaxID=3031126 RepID=UPI0023E14643|nr:hypothetical protein [Pararhizobium qamdonense]